MPLKPCKPDVEFHEASDPFRDLGSTVGDQPRQRAARVGAMARVAPGGDASRVLQWDVQTTKIDEQPEMLDIGLLILAVPIRAPGRPRQPARALVEADRVGGDADPLRQLADPHALITSLSSYVFPSLSWNHAALAMPKSARPSTVLRPPKS